VCSLDCGSANVGQNEIMHSVGITSLVVSVLDISRAIKKVSAGGRLNCVGSLEDEMEEIRIKILPPIQD
jgi:hypothetical protein